MRYLTPSQYYLNDDSVPGAEQIDPAVLNRTINRAETLIDAYCGFDARMGGFEPHTVWYQDAFDEKTLKVFIPNHPVPVRKITRYRIQVSNQANGAGFFADINTSDCAINVFGSYVEIVPLQAVTYSLTPFMLGLGLRPPLTQIDYEAGFYFGVTGETLDNPSYDLTVYRALRGFWANSYDQASIIQPNVLPVVPPNVYVNGALQSNGYSIDYTEGTVTFTTPLTSSDVVTADYTYTIPDPVSQATVLQVTWMLNQRMLSQMGLGGIEVARTRNQMIKRHIRTQSGNSSRDEPAIDPGAMQLLEPYTFIPLG